MTIGMGETDPPRNRHRTLRPRAMDDQSERAKRETSASEVEAVAAGDRVGHC